VPTAKPIDRKRILPISGVILVVVLTVLSGVIQGRMSNRWGPPRAVLAAAEKLDDIPSQFGDWRLTSSDEIIQSTLKMLECTGYILRTYENQATGEAVRMSVLLGPSGPMSVHTPEICYSSRDYTVHEERHQVPIEIDGSSESFWALTFQSNSLDADMLRVYYAWNAGDRWSAPEDPRFAFADRPFLYKIQLASQLPPGADLEAVDPCHKFLKDFVPLARSYLVVAR
jgi:hypothetical protein